MTTTRQIMRIPIPLATLSLIPYTYANAELPEIFGECLPSSQDHSHFHCFAARDNVRSSLAWCEDTHPECPPWAERGECDKNPAYMLKECRKSCHTCPDGHAGITQLAPHDVAHQVGEHWMGTRVYMQQEQVDHAQCRNEHAMCTFWAVQGECESNAPWMSKHCAPACRTCGRSDR